MAAFGEQDYGTPLGALNPFEFFGYNGNSYYDYSGFSSRGIICSGGFGGGGGGSGTSGFSGFSGFSGIVPGFSCYWSGLMCFSGEVGWTGHSAFCVPQGIVFLPWMPALTYPLNFDILQGVVWITWKEPRPADPCGDGVVYELQFTRTLSRNSGWKTLSYNIPSGTSEFAFDVSGIPYTDDGGIRIRAKNTRNLCSAWSVSNGPFTIADHPPNPVMLLSPGNEEAYDATIPVIWQEANPRDIDGQKVTYLIEITDSFSNNSGWIPIPGADQLPQGTTIFTVCSYNMPEGNDYGIVVYAVNEMGTRSVPALAGPFAVSHPGSFVVDTLPPEGAISINNGAVLATNRMVKMSLFASDVTTGVKDVRFMNAEENCWSDWDSYSTEKFWQLPQTDGVKKVLVQFRDYANNASSACDCDIVSKVICSEGNATDLEVFENNLYVAFDANGNLLRYRVLVNTAAALAQPEITALATTGSALYIAAYDASSTSYLYQYAGQATQILSVLGKVLTMVAYNGVIYMGLDNGSIKSYDGTSLMTVYSGLVPITRLRTDGAILYATPESSNSFLTTADGITWVSTSLY